MCKLVLKIPCKKVSRQKHTEWYLRNCISSGKTNGLGLKLWNVKEHSIHLNSLSTPTSAYRLPLVDSVSCCVSNSNFYAGGCPRVPDKNNAASSICTITYCVLFFGNDITFSQVWAPNLYCSTVSSFQLSYVTPSNFEWWSLVKQLHYPRCHKSFNCTGVWEALIYFKTKNDVDKR